MKQAAARETSRKDKILNFDPSGVGDSNAGIYGLPFTPEEAAIVLIPVPWEVTVSYSAGTALGPEAIKAASSQMDLFDPFIPDAWQIGLALEPVDTDWHQTSTNLREQSAAYIQYLEGAESILTEKDVTDLLGHVNEQGAQLLSWLKQKATAYLNNGQLVGVVGGDHSSPLGLLHALAEKHEEFGIIQIDAHADLREAYEGFTYSHASIMYNALQLPQVKKLVQVGIRDSAESENELIRHSNGRISTFFDSFLKNEMYDGKTWKKQCKKIIAQLPPKVYISFDIDGLDPKLCPGTGTPVPGGLEFEEALYLIKALVKSGREIIGFDLCEVAPGDSAWNGNVGARLLYQLSNWMAVSNKIAQAAGE